MHNKTSATKGSWCIIFLLLHQTLPNDASRAGFGTGGETQRELAIFFFLSRCRIDFARAKTTKREGLSATGILILTRSARGTTEDTEELKVICDGLSSLGAQLIS